MPSTGPRLQIGLVNIMPNARDYEQLLRAALGDERPHVDLHPIRLDSHDYRSSAAAIGDYPAFDEAVARTPLDLLILTGAPVEHLPYDEIRYWGEIQRILGYAQRHLRSVLGICFGGLAVARFLGVDKRVRDDKLFGVQPLQVAPDAMARSLLGRGDTPHLALSTWALLDEGEADAAARRGLRTLARHPDLGPLVLATQDERMVMVLGHPEYTVQTLYQEWQRDIPKGIAYTRDLDEHDFAAMAGLLEQHAPPILAHWVRHHRMACQAVA